MALPLKRCRMNVIIIGESGVGKTALMNKFVCDKFSEHYKSTIGADFHNKEIKIKNDVLMTMCIWDTAGQERFQSLGNAFHRGTDACFMVYDVTNKESFDKLDKWRITFISIANPYNAIYWN